MDRIRLKLNNPNMNWYYLNDAGEVAGPVSDSTLAELRSINRLADNAQVCREGSEDWISLAEALGTAMINPAGSPEAVTPKQQLAPEKKRNSGKGGLIGMIGGVMIAAGVTIFFFSRDGDPKSANQIESVTEASEEAKEPAGESNNQSKSNTSRNDGKSKSSKEKASSEEIFQHGLRYFNGEKFPGEAAVKRDVEPKDLDHALTLFLQAAENGHAEAQYYAAVCYGASVPPKMQEAKRWMQQSADQGLTKAQYLLGVGYISGDFGEKDDTKGLSWISRAAEDNYADAQWLLGLRHLRGEGINLDEKRAAALFLRACLKNSFKQMFGCTFVPRSGRNSAWRVIQAV